MLMKQQTLAMAADQTFENYRKPTRRDEFLKTMEAIFPWQRFAKSLNLAIPRQVMDVHLSVLSACCAFILFSIGSTWLKHRNELGERHSFSCGINHGLKPGFIRPTYASDSAQLWIS